MNTIDTIFTLHDEAVARSVSALRERFGSLWQPEDGIILYPPNGNARDYATLLHLTVPHIPLIICDNAPSTDEELSGQKILSLAEATRQLPRALFVLCTTGDSASELFAAVAPHVSEAHCNNMITFRQLGECLPAGDRKTRAFDVYRKTYLAASPRNRKKVAAAFALFQDRLSQAVFTSVLKRYLLCSDTLIPVSSSPEYFEDVYTPLDDEVFVDCGAFSGDTLQTLLSLRNSRLKEYHGFEPDAGNFRLLCATRDAMPANLRAGMHLYPCAVGHEQSELSFDATGTMGSMVNPEGETRISSVTLDETLKNVTPTLMKFDIEGYEAFALQGGREVIRRARPVLALCVYHHPFDLWELPLMVNDMVDGYHFFLRAYQEQFSYTCYCVPEERLAASTIC